MASHCRKEHSETRYVYGMDGNRLTCPCTAPAVSHLTPIMPSLVVRGDIPSCATMRFGTWQQAFSAKSAVTCRLSPPLYHCLVKLSFTDPQRLSGCKTRRQCPRFLGRPIQPHDVWRARLPPQRTLFKISFCDQPIRQTREGEAATIRATSKGRRRSIFCTTGLLHFWRNGPSRRVDLQAVGKPALRDIGPWATLQRWMSCGVVYRLRFCVRPSLLSVDHAGGFLAPTSSLRLHLLRQGWRPRAVLTTLSRYFSLFPPLYLSRDLCLLVSFFTFLEES